MCEADGRWSPDPAAFMCTCECLYSYTGEIYVHGFGNVISTNKVTIKLWLGLRPQQCGTYDFIMDEIPVNSHFCGFAQILVV